MKVTARSRRVLLTAAVPAAAALLAAGCGPSSTSSSSSPPPASSPSSAPSSSFDTPPATTSPATPVPTPPSPTAAPKPGSGGGSGSGAAACASSELKASIGARQGAAGSTYTNIDFTNTGSHSCTLYGYPGVSLANSGGPIGASATRDSTHPKSMVTLAPGATANAILRVVVAQNYPSSTCNPDASSFLLIYPPNQTAAIDVPYQGTGCRNNSVKVLSISPVASGSR